MQTKVHWKYNDADQKIGFHSLSLYPFGFSSNRTIEVFSPDRGSKLAGVSWSALGSQDVQVTLVYGKGLELAASVAERLNEGLSLQEIVTLSQLIIVNP